MKYKALITDVDGTLVINSPDAIPSERVTHAISQATKQIFVGIATSRCIDQAKAVIDHLQLSGPSILNGGGQILEFPSGNPMTEQTLNKEDALFISNVYKKYNLPFFICDGENPDALFTGTLPKKSFMIVCQKLEPNLAEKIISEISHLPFVSTFTTRSWTKGKTDVLSTSIQATKQHGIYEVAKLLEISTDEIIGVGDGHNDFPLLMACGLKVAMGNAGEDLKAIADYIAPTVEEDGLADVIEKFVLNAR